MSAAVYDLDTHRRVKSLERPPGEFSSMEDARINSNYDKWCDTIRLRLSRLLKLPRDWDGYGADPITHQLAMFTFQILMASWQSGLPLPDLTPLSDGSILIEWFGENAGLTIEVEEPYKIHFTASGLDNIEQSEGTISHDLSLLFVLTKSFVRLNTARQAG